MATIRARLVLAYGGSVGEPQVAHRGIAMGIAIVTLREQWGSMLIVRSAAIGAFVWLLWLLPACSSTDDRPGEVPATLPLTRLGTLLG